MQQLALKLLKKIEEHGFQAYIVGGFVRDVVMNKESNDVDICTNARPADVRKIFLDACLPNECYGAVVVMYHKIRFEITTFRKEFTYIDSRRPVEFEFIDDLYEDLKRRDFLINTLCMNSNGEIIDLLNGKEDIEHRVIHTVGNSFIKFTEDSLRILRAIRFATILDFSLSDDIKDSIQKTKHYVRNLSFDRKKEELNKIFASKNIRYGVKLLISLGLDKELKLHKLRQLKNFDDLMGVWAQLDLLDSEYPFTKNERNIIKQIQKVIEFDNLDPKILYKYGLYVNSVAALIKGIDKKKVTYAYNQLSIKSRSDICVNGVDIIKLLDIKPGKCIKTIIQDIENKILYKELENDYQGLVGYIKNTYHDCVNL